jgi:hypothetical protein
MKGDQFLEEMERIDPELIKESEGYRAGRSRRKKTLAVILSAAAVLLLVGTGVGIGVSQRIRREGGKETAEENAKTEPAAPASERAERQEYAEAETALRDALSMTTPGAGHIRAIIFGHLADIVHRRGQDAQALDDATEALKEERFYEPPLSLLGTILRALPAADAIQFLNTIYDPVADAEFLVRTLAKSGLYEVCLYYDKKAGGRIMSEGERLLFAKVYPSAARELARAMMRGYAMESLAAKRTGAEPDLPDRLRDADTELSHEMQGYISKLEQVFPWEKGRDER